MKNILFLLSFTLLSISTHATTWTVNSTNNAGVGSLRAAIDSAANFDIINFNPNLIATGSDSIVLNSSIVFSKSLTIKGLYSATDTLFISGGGNDRIFTVTNTAHLILDWVVLQNGSANGEGGAVKLTDTDSIVLRNSILRNNTVSTVTSQNAYGGAIYAYCQFKNIKVGLSNSEIYGNFISSLGGNTAAGAGIYAYSLNNSSTVLLDSSSVSRNSCISNYVSGSSAGGISSGSGSYSPTSISLVELNYSQVSNNVVSSNTGSCSSGGISSGSSNAKAFVNLNYSTVEGNSVTSSSSPGKGGGISCASSGAANQATLAFAYVNLYYSTVANNSVTITGNALAEGGGIRCESGYSGVNTSPTAEVNVTNSTVYGNSIYSNNYDAKGGGIYCESGQGHVVNVLNSTITNNTAVANSATAYGAGIYSYSQYTYTASNINITSSIVALNSSDNIYNNLTPFLVSGGYNIFSNTTLANAIASDQIGVTSLNLSAYGFHGGPTKTLMPNSSSVAINNGNPANTSDAQNAYVNGIRDVGAAELCLPTYAIDTVLNCSSYTWIDGITYTSSNNTAIFTMLNIGGCDSVITLNLTISIPTSATDIQTGCNSFTWINGVTYTSSNNTAIDTLVNATGCDSIVTLNLTMLSTDITTTQFTDTIMANQTGAAYQWIDCSTNSIVTGDTNQYFIPSVTGNYAVEVDSNGCIDTSACVFVGICNLQAGYSFVDNGSGNYSFTNSSTGSYTNSHWAFGDGDTSLAVNPSHTFNANGWHVVTLAIYDSLVSGGSCIRYFTDTINVSGVTNPAQCNAGWTVLADSTTGGVTVVNSSTGTNLTYHWDFGDGDTSNLQYPSHTYSSNGPFNLCLTVDDGAGCSDTYCDSISSNGVLFKNGFDLNVVATYPLGIQNIGEETNVKIYPNPTSSTLNIETTNFKITKIQILDYSGKVVKTITSSFDVVYVESLATGVYHLELIGESETITKKFIKQ